MFDVFGQMWGTMLINGMTVLCTITGMLGVCANEKAAIGVVGTLDSCNLVYLNLISISVNLLFYIHMQ